MGLTHSSTCQYASLSKSTVLSTSTHQTVMLKVGVKSTRQRPPAQTRSCTNPSRKTSSHGMKLTSDFPHLCHHLMILLRCCRETPHLGPQINPLHAVRLHISLRHSMHLTQTTTSVVSYDQPIFEESDHYVQQFRQSIPHFSVYPDLP